MIREPHVDRGTTCLDSGVHAGVYLVGMSTSGGVAVLDPRPRTVSWPRHGPRPPKLQHHKLQPNSKKTGAEGMKRHTHCRKLYVQQLYRIYRQYCCAAVCLASRHTPSTP